MTTPQTRIWYDRSTRNWVGQILDADGNQVGDAEIAYTRREVQLAVAHRLTEPTVAPLIRNPHPWYGPCDAMGPRGECWECFTMKATDAELEAVADTLSVEAEYAREDLFRRRAV